MNKSVLLAETAILALAAGGAMASHPATAARTTNVHPIVAPARTLYSQNSNFETYSILSQNFTSGSVGTADNAAAADDFVVPTGNTWKITGLDVTGLYFNGSGPATSEVVTFYKGKRHPEKVIGTPQTLNCTDVAGSFSCNLGRVRLRSGHYWVSIVANCSFAGGCGEWGWTQTLTHNDPGQWENPGGGLETPCTTWEDTSKCIQQVGVVDDFAFDLTGKR